MPSSKTRRFSLKKFAGVYYEESTIRRWHNKPDRIYSINFRDKEGRLRWEKCGWASEGWTPGVAQRVRFKRLEDDRVGEYKSKSERKSDKLLFTEFVENKYLPWAKNEKKSYRDDESRYRNWLADRFDKKTLKEISPLDLERIKSDMRKAGKSDATIKHVLCLVRQIYNKARIWGAYSGENPSNNVKFPGLNNMRSKFLSYEEAEVLLAALYDVSPTVGDMASLSLYTGMRLSEIQGLTKEDVDLQNRRLYVRDTKNNEARPIVITDRIIPIIQDRLTKDGALLFPSEKGGEAKWLSHTFDRTVKRLGFNEGIVDNRNKVVFHTLRHTFASWAALKGVQEFPLSKALGHKSSAMTRRYSHLNPEGLEKVFQVVSDTGPEKQTATNVFTIKP